MTAILNNIFSFQEENATTTCHSNKAYSPLVTASLLTSPHQSSIDGTLNGNSVIITAKTTQLISKPNHLCLTFKQTQVVCNKNHMRIKETR
ncbi:hypothetical protein [Iodobacter fluviatilis]|jgi:hypothetical protein|uniref:Uncharacterized protein n=1 Tax=Iodobacter fluviatilis TaxID=537 RepID=A0A7G3G5B7_9NEIS|nr:hypothetical protein [Iodobacter fluviatilis]QBC42298.1 hypothetical protein C1H71_01130 [Iodobacter fluviatilis]